MSRRSDHLPRSMSSHRRRITALAEARAMLSVPARIIEAVLAGHRGEQPAYVVTRSPRWEPAPPLSLPAALSHDGGAAIVRPPTHVRSPATPRPPPGERPGQKPTSCWSTRARPNRSDGAEELWIRQEPSSSSAHVPMRLRSQFAETGTAATRDRVRRSRSHTRTRADRHASLPLAVGSQGAAGRNLERRRRKREPDRLGKSRPRTLRHPTMPT